MNGKLFLIFGVFCSQTGFGVTITELDEFNAPGGGVNPNEGWLEGGNSVTSPFQQLTGGPDGSGYLNDFSAGVSQGARVQLWNTDQWTGNYVGQSIQIISMDAINLSGAGGEDLHFRVAFNGPGGWFVSEPQTILPETGWQSLVFDISIGGLVHAGGGTAAYDSTMSEVNRMQIISLESGGAFVFGGNSGLRGELVAATWGLDNIQAGGAIPEPSSMGLLLLGGLGGLRRRR